MKLNAIAKDKRIKYMLWNCKWLFVIPENVPNGDDIFPKVNQVVNRVTCASSFDGNCCKNKIPIKIKNCGTHLVYYLTPAADCNTAYCFGM